MDIKPPDFKGPEFSKNVESQPLDTPASQPAAPLAAPASADIEGARLAAELTRADLNDPVRRETAIDAALSDIMAERLDAMGLGPNAEGRQTVLAFMREDPMIREHVLAYLEQILP